MPGGKTDESQAFSVSEAMEVGKSKAVRGQQAAPQDCALAAGRWGRAVEAAVTVMWLDGVQIYSLGKNIEDHQLNKWS